MNYTLKLAGIRGKSQSMTLSSTTQTAMDINDEATNMEQITQIWLGIYNALVYNTVKDKKAQRNNNEEKLVNL